MTALASILLLLASAATGPEGGELRREAEDFLGTLAARGYTGTALEVVELYLLEPCTLAVYPPDSTGGGFFVGMGGNNVLDLELSVCGDGWVLTDTMPDDLPVIELGPGEAAEARLAVLRATDMTRGALSDSAALLWALEPVDLEAAQP